MITKKRTIFAIDQSKYCFFNNETKFLMLILCYKLNFDFFAVLKVSNACFAVK
jgi:hypothetical protein